MTFCGEYPIGYVEYRDPNEPIEVSLEVFSPFIPLNTDDSSLPATIMHVKIKNVGKEQIEARLCGYLGNAVCCNTGPAGSGTRENRVVRNPRLTMVECRASPSAAFHTPGDRARRFPEGNLRRLGRSKERLSARGRCSSPRCRAYQGDVGGPGLRVVNSHAAAPGSDVAEKDRQTGKLTSRPFTIERKFITFWIGGGNHPGKTCINLLVDGKIVRTATGQNDNRMRPEAFDVHEWEGKTARLEIVDHETGPWGNIGVGRIAMTDQPAGKLEEQPDFGTMALGLLGPQPDDQADCDMRPIALPGEGSGEGTLADGGLSSQSQAYARLPHGCPGASERPDRPPVCTRSMSLDARQGGHGHLRHRLALPQPVAEGRRAVLCQPLRVGPGGGRVCGRELRPPGRPDAALARHVVRLHAALLVPRPHVGQHLDPGHLDLPPLPARAGSTAGRAWAAARAPVPTSGTTPRPWPGSSPQLERDLRQRTDFGMALDPEDRA